MELKYTVRSCAENEIEVKATVAGREVTAKIPGLVVELESEDGGMGHTYRLTPDDMEEAKTFFSVDNEITITFTNTTAPAAEATPTPASTDTATN